MRQAVRGCLAAAAAALAAACSAPAAPAAAPAPAGRPRPLPRVLYGVTADDLSGLAGLVAADRHLPERPVTRLYFDAAQPPAAYAAAVRALRPVSYLMGELLDSSDEAGVGVVAYGRRVRAYLDAFGSSVDVWEVGNEVNGDWTGPYPQVEAKLAEAYGQVAARHLPTALTLYYNAGCGDGAGELDPVAFSRKYVPAGVRDGLSYVFLSYYEDACGGARPSAAAWTAYFRELHALYPRARVGFGEVGMQHPATKATAAAAGSLIARYYGLKIALPYYAGGYFWWYYAEDCVPYSAKPLWRSLAAGFRAEAKALA